MWRRPGTLVAAVVVGVAALVPLFGDPRSTPVTHPLWARLLLRALEMNDAVRTSTQASQVFAILAWRDSISLPADGYLRRRRPHRAPGGGTHGRERGDDAGRGDVRPRGRAAGRLPAARADRRPARHVP